MEMNERIRRYIKSNGWTYTFVAKRAGYDFKKLCRQMRNQQAIDTDEYEKLCKGLLVDPTFFYEDKFLVSKN
jgi:transcriptional regulator with XRE-family HTH domain